MLALVLHPSRHIPLEKSVLGPYPDGLDVSAGQSIIFSAPENISVIYRHGIRATALRENKYFVGVGLPTQKSYALIGIGTQPLAHPLLHILAHPKITWFHNSFSMDIPVPKKRSHIRLPADVRARLDAASEDQRRADREKVIQAFAVRSEELNYECHQRPLASVVVSKYASPRRLPNGREYYHGGLDLRAAVGTPVLASASGTIVLADEMVVPGKNVIIDHGRGLFSRYMHLDKWAVEAGESVRKGQKIGYAGATGRVEAPHLHWEIVWQGIPLSPLDFLAAWEQICDQG